jgi:hypothetical protein
MSGIARSCLGLAQISAVVDSDMPAAMHHLSYPVNLMQPTFKEIAGLVAEGVAGRRLWNGQLLSMGSELERVLCFILLGRFDDLASDYAACNDPTLFSPLDQDWVLPLLSRQILYCAIGQHDRVSFANYAKAKGLKKSDFFHGYELLVEAVAHADSAGFSRELELRHAAYSLRQRSRKSDPMWGYGHEGRDCFDVIGTALCRLAAMRGLSVESPSERIYPRALWSGGAI